MPEQTEQRCPPHHATAECRMYGSAYYHAIIRSLWARQLQEWRRPAHQEDRDR